MKKTTRYLMLLVEVGVVISLSRGLIGALKTRDSLKDLEVEKKKLEEEKKTLEERLKEVKKPDYLEYVAREELNLTKPEETLVIVDKELLEKDEGKRGVMKEKLKNWQKWRLLILGF